MANASSELTLSASSRLITSRITSSGLYMKHEWRERLKYSKGQNLNPNVIMSVRWKNSQRKKYLVNLNISNRYHLVGDERAVS